ncbi:MAG: D-Ala-D-Ala carboxypeptidase family metallohydrolase [Elainellaceae cyanobacterium]
MMKLTVTKNTVFKQRPQQSRDLPDLDKFLAPQNTEFDVIAHEPASANHVRVTFPAPVGLQPEDTWYVFREHISIEGNEPGNNPREPETPTVKRSGGFNLSGYRSRFYLEDPVLPGGNFTWAEVTKNGQRMPQTKSIVGEVLRIAHTIQDIRDMFGDRPVTITSWYRDPVSNRRVGGARQSRHLTGGAVDFKISGVSPAEVQRRLDSWWGSRGGLASASTFTHIDNRGYRARWRYGR